MRFEWDDEKNEKNRKNHGISFETARAVFTDPLHLAIPDNSSEGEDRFWAIGCLENLAVIVVIHTYRLRKNEEVIRIISARPATSRERFLYEENDNFDI